MTCSPTRPHLRMCDGRLCPTPLNRGTRSRTILWPSRDLPRRRSQQSLPLPSSMNPKGLCCLSSVRWKGRHVREPASWSDPSGRAATDNRYARGLRLPQGWSRATQTSHDPGRLPRRDKPVVSMVPEGIGLKRNLKAQEGRQRAARDQPVQRQQGPGHHRPGLASPESSVLPALVLQPAWLPGGASRALLAVSPCASARARAPAGSWP